jgi:CheY-like chemotaxis protein
MNPTDRAYQILVIEDDPAEMCLLKEAFEECGRACGLTFSRSDRLEELLSPNQFHLILMDFGRDIQEATHLVGFIKERARYTPIIVLSNYPDTLPAYQAGVNAFIHKGVEIDDLFKKITALMHFWSTIAVLPSGALMPWPPN